MNSPGLKPGAIHEKSSSDKSDELYYFEEVF